MKNTPKRIAKFSGSQSINCIADVEKFRYWNWVLQLIAICNCSAILCNYIDSTSGHGLPPAPRGWIQAQAAF